MDSTATNGRWIRHRGCKGMIDDWRIGLARKNAVASACTGPYGEVGRWHVSADCNWRCRYMDMHNHCTKYLY
jgi:hypothetical protein